MKQKKRMLKLGYDNNGNYILMSYLKLLRIDSNWKKLQDLVASIKEKITKNNKAFDKK